VVPVLASILIGVGVKVGLGLAATAAKKLMEPAAVSGGAQSFPSLLNASASASPSAPGAASGLSAQPLARVPYDLPGRLVAERLHGIALDVQAHRGVPGPALDAGDLLANYRRIKQAP
jgi:hypothetical protein